MKNKLIALAVAAAMTAPAAAFAGSTVGGNLQVELGSVDVGADDAANSVPVNGLTVRDESRGAIWIKGSEDLGGGLKALYHAEWKVDTSNNAGGGSGKAPFAAREINIGIQNKKSFGTFRFGTVKPAYKYTGGVKYDPMVATMLEARTNGGMTGKFGPNSGSGSAGFAPNAISWKKKFGMVGAWIVYNTDELANQDGTMTAALKASGSSWEAFVAMSETTSGATNAAGGTLTKEYSYTKVGGQWKGGAHKVSCQYETGDATDSGATTVTRDDDYYFCNYQLKMGKNVFTASYGNNENKEKAGNTTLSTDYLMIAAIHKFSPTTKAWVGYRDEDGDSTGTPASAGKLNDPLGAPTKANTANNDENVISIGMQVKF